jgi:hypothetical protein
MSTSFAPKGFMNWRCLYMERRIYFSQLAAELVTGDGHFEQAAFKALLE